MSFLDFFRSQNVSSLKEKRDIDGLIRVFLNHKDAAVRKEAADALGSLGDVKAVDPLITAVSGSDDALKGSAILALDKIGDTKAINPVFKALTSNFQFMEKFTLNPENFGRILFESLILSLKHKEWYFRKAGARALGKMKKKEAVDYLIPLLNDDIDSVKEAAARALDLLGWKPYMEMMKKEFDELSVSLNNKDQDIGRNAGERLMQYFGNEGLEVLKEAIRDADSSAFRNASWAFYNFFQGPDFKGFKKRVDNEKMNNLRREINQLYAIQIEKCPDYLDQKGALILMTLRAIGDPSVLPALNSLAEKMKAKYKKTGVHNVHVVTAEYSGTYSSDSDLREVEEVIGIIQKMPQ